MPGAQQLWSLTPNLNQTADPFVNMREGMSPSQLNDAIRQIMSRVKAFALDVSGALVTAGTQPAYTVATNEVITSYVDGYVVAFRAHAANTGAATLAVDGLTAKNLHKTNGVALVAGDLVAGKIYRAMYLAADDRFVMHDAAASAQLVAPAGTRMPFNQTTAPVGWTKETDSAFNDAALRLVTGTASGGNTTPFSTAFTSRSIAIGNLPVGNIGTAASAGSHSHPINNQGTSNVSTLRFVGAGGTLNSNSGSSVGAAALGTDAAGDHTHNVTSLGSGTPLDFAVKFRDFIVAQKD